MCCAKWYSRRERVSEWKLKIPHQKWNCRVGERAHILARRRQRVIHAEGEKWIITRRRSAAHKHRTKTQHITRPCNAICRTCINDPAERKRERGKNLWHEHFPFSTFCVLPANSFPKHYTLLRSAATTHPSTMRTAESSAPGVENINIYWNHNFISRASCESTPENHRLPPLNMIRVGILNVHFGYFLSHFLFFGGCSAEINF